MPWIKIIQKPPYLDKDVTKLEIFLIQSNTSIMEDTGRGYASFLETHNNGHSNIPSSYKVIETSWEAQLAKLMGRKTRANISWVSATHSALYCDVPETYMAFPRLQGQGGLLRQPRSLYNAIYYHASHPWKVFYIHMYIHTPHFKWSSQQIHKSNIIIPFYTN